ncbi:MAG: O-antigen ligase family protein [Elusimicrobia bacterium]|nr:O-antigen ligase family protein [Elusimicrobiota bacterium]
MPFAAWSLGLLGIALLAGGLREPVLGALGAGAVGILAAFHAPLPLGPAAWWLPWLFWALLSCLVSVQPCAGLPVIARWAAFVIYFAMAAQWDARLRRHWHAVLCALGAIIALAALASGAGRGFGANMTGLLPPYYNYSIFVVTAAAASAVALALNARSSRQSAALWALAAGLAACVLIARSRGGVLGLVAAGLWLTWRRAGAKTALILIAIGAFTGLAAPHDWTELLLKRRRALGEARPAIWRVAAGLAGHSPWFGEGPGNFASGFRRDPVEAKGAAARWGLWTPYAHSEPMHAAAETGWVGLVLWLAGFVAMLAGAFRTRGDLNNAPQTAARAALIAAVPQLFVDNMLQLPGLAFLFASAAAVARPIPSPASNAGISRPALLVLAVFALVAVAPDLYSRVSPGAPLAMRRAVAERAVRLFPADSDRMEDLAYVLEQSREIAQAYAAWAAAERLSPKNAIYPWRRGRLLMATTRPADAERAFAQALALEPSFLAARADRVAALSALGDFARAGAELDELRARAAAPRPGAILGYESTVSLLDPAAIARAEEIVRKGKMEK